MNILLGLWRRLRPSRSRLELDRGSGRIEQLCHTDGNGLIKDELELSGLMIGVDSGFLEVGRIGRNGAMLH